LSVVASTYTGRVQAFGHKRVGEVVSFEVPASTASVTIVSQAVTAKDGICYQGSLLGNTVVPGTVVDPSGVIYDDSAPLPADLTAVPTLPVYYLGESVATGTMTIPNTTRMLDRVASGGGLAPGSWRFTVNDYAYECLALASCSGGSAGGVYDVTVVTKPGAPAPGPTIPDSGTLDLSFYLVTQSGLTAATAANQPDVKRMLQTLGTLLAGGGINLGTVAFKDVSDAARVKYATGVSADKTGPCDELSQMFTLSQPGNALNLFLVDDITSTGAGGRVVGIDGTIPGPSTFGGVVHGGAAVSIADLHAVRAGGSCSGAIDIRCGADLVAFIAAHETGHFLGLYHTTEGVGEYFDPLGDTPICKCDTCKPDNVTTQKCLDPDPSAPANANPYLVTGTNCAPPLAKAGCGGGDNLMFWLLSGVSQGTLSAQQGKVMRANLLVH
jgi:hypothetical protein